MHPDRIIFAEILPPQFAEAVYELLDACSDEFVPPLSQRISTHQQDLNPSEASGDGGVRSYFNEMATQAFLLALDDREELVSFLSYIPSYQLPADTLSESTAYVSTICTSPEARGKGIAKALYLELERVVTDRPISLRTWSTNSAQVHLLQQLGYHEVLRLKDDRGEGIDTVYYVKELMNE